MHTDKATPRPWGLERDGITLTMSGQIVATAIAPDGAGIAEQRANAALIVRAVNAHDAMREALRMMNADLIAGRVRAMALDPSARCEQYAMLLGEIGTAARAALALADQETTP